MNKTWCVYKHTNKNNGKCYIGVTSQSPDSRWKKGEGYKSCTSFYRAIQKYTWDGFEHEVLFDGLCESDAKEYEVLLINQFKSNNPLYGYNLTNGGDGLSGYLMSLESREKLRKSHVGRFRGENSANYGKHFSQYTKAKMSDAKKNSYIGCGNPFYGLHHSAETKERISKTKRLNGMNNERPVLCVNTGLVYRSCSEAGRVTGCDSSAISKCCNGKYLTTHGFRWQYANRNAGDE